jgi:hypothetical protein
VARPDPVDGEVAPPGHLVDPILGDVQDPGASRAVILAEIGGSSAVGDSVLVMVETPVSRTLGPETTKADGSILTLVLPIGAHAKCAARGEAA